jgi:hypothetical protein
MTTQWDELPDDIRAAFSLLGVLILGYDVTENKVVIAWGNGCTPNPLETEIRDGYRGYVKVWRLAHPVPRETYLEIIDYIAARFARCADSAARPP